MRTFYQLLTSALLVSTTNNFVWFALTFWTYLMTNSVIATGAISGIYLVATAISSFYLGSLVDHHKKKNTMITSSLITLSLFATGLALYLLTPQSIFTDITSITLWIFIVTLLLGTISGNVYNIAIPTLVTILIPKDMRDRANGMYGTVIGISFALTSVASGLTLAYGGMLTVLIASLVMTTLAIIVTVFIKIPEKEIAHNKANPQKMDIRGTIKIISGIPGLFALIFFTTFNNFLGGIFMALMDAYGLSLVPVQVWGAMWGVLSFGFIFGGLYIAKRGLGKSPLVTLFRVNIIMWITCIFFAIQPSIYLLAAGMLIWMCLVPFIEATEQTIIQKVVPHERQGRVFGLAQSIEQAASPVTAFIIGPIAQLIFIPFMTTGRGVDLIGDWFGTGTGRGIALVFITAGVIGLAVTLICMRSNAYKRLATYYLK